MRDEQELAPAPQGGGLIFWIEASSKRAVWLRYGALLVLPPFLLVLPTFFSGPHAPDAPAQALGLAFFLVLIISAWMSLADVVFRLPARSLVFARSYLIGSALAVLLALVLWMAALLLDQQITPTGHFFAVQGVFAILLTLVVPPIARSMLLHEPLTYYWHRMQRGEADWRVIETDMRRVLARHPAALRPGMLLLEALLRQGKREEARNWLAYLVNTHPRAWGVWAALGALGLEEEQWERAGGALKRAYRLAPVAARGSLHLCLGLSYLGVGMLERGFAELEQARRQSLPPHLRHFVWYMLMGIGQVQQDPLLMLQATQSARRRPKDARAFLAWYATLDRSHLATLGEDLYDAADWTRHLLGIRRVA
jgi:tetratricopeptide (TPR) repeat protein